MSGPTPAQIAAAADKAQAKAAAAAKKAADAAAAQAKQVADDQAWLDTQTANMSDADKDELFRAASKNCAGTTMKDGKITIACPLPRKMLACVPPDSFDCPNGRVNDDDSKGCKLSTDAAKALVDPATGTKIDASVTSAGEGGSSLSPYVPWGPLAHVNSVRGQPLSPPKLTAGNSSGVTIGTGVDLGQIGNADTYIAALKKRGVSQDTLDKIKPLIGKKKQDACAALRAAKGGSAMVLPQSDVEKIDAQAMAPRVTGVRNAYENASDQASSVLTQGIAKATKAGDTATAAALQAKLDAIPDWADVSAPKQTIMFDSFFQEGNLNGSAKSFTSAVLSNDDDAATAALKAKVNSSNSALSSRGAVELAFFTGQ